MLRRVVELVKEGDPKAILCAAAAVLILRRLLSSKKKITQNPAHAEPTEMPNCGVLDLRRRSQLAYAKPLDHAQDLVMVINENFDLDATIFGAIKGSFTRSLLRDKLGVTPHWSDKAVIRIEHAFQSVPRALKHDTALMNFMRDDCDFAMEHADGSFLDHLQFCAEYSHVHFNQVSPRVLFLHSIMGVGTNFFPMQDAQIPKLKSLLSDFEYQHIEAFPSILRLLYARAGKNILEELMACSNDQLKKLKSVEFHRVMGNTKLTMDAEAFWTQLNFHVIHLLDFLPASNWAITYDALFENFQDLHALLTRAGKLMCKLDFEVSTVKETPAGKVPWTLSAFVASLLPDSAKRKGAALAVVNFSAACGHSLDYTINWSD